MFLFLLNAVQPQALDGLSWILNRKLKLVFCCAPRIKNKKMLLPQRNPVLKTNRAMYIFFLVYLKMGLGAVVENFYLS